MECFVEVYGHTFNPWHISLSVCKFMLEEKKMGQNERIEMNLNNIGHV